MTRLAPLLALAACGTPPPVWSPDAGPCQPYVVPAGTDLAAPTVGFADVVKVFGASCGAAQCHGSTAPKGGVFLGASSAHGADADAIYAALVGVPSGELPRMAFVAPGDPSASYLMHKLDGDQCQFSAECTNGDCAHVMPMGGESTLPLVSRDTIRRWIAQGARRD